MVEIGVKQLIAEANSQVESVSAAEAADLLGKEHVVFVDVREADERRQGFIPGSVHVPRGFLEFIADPDGPAHNAVLSSGKVLVLYCASGMRSLLAAKRLQDMGLTKVYNLSGGMHGWALGGGAVSH
ncbi:MAG TPA: rhodanese-like domain-containing protein [Kiloniellaceae bacterium]|nr:rhodanese-like domain-containing protein [Kiloniellaceae bacterium]